MKKKVMSVLIAATLLTAGTMSAALADTAKSDTPEDVVTATAIPDGSEEVTPDAEITDIAAPLAMPSYISNSVDVVSMDDKTISTVISTMDAENPENVINYTITADTVVLGKASGDVKTLEDIKEGDTITVYSNAYAPAPLILPPLYQADVIFVDDAKEISSLRFNEVDTFIENEDGMLVSAGNTLALNVDDSTIIMEVKGKKIIKADELANMDLAVIYSMSTRSIPPQTTPIAIIVLGENETALAQIEAAKAETPDLTETPAPTETPVPTETPAPDMTKATRLTAGNYAAPISYNSSKKTFMVPVRAIAEALGHTVGWDGDNMGVTVDDVMFKIGFNSYIKSEIAQSLETAPELINDTTFIPVSLFDEVLGHTITVDGDTLVIK